MHFMIMTLRENWAQSNLYNLRGRGGGRGE